MATTTDFKEWLTYYKQWIDQPSEVEALYLAVRNEEDHTIVKCESLIVRGTYLVSCAFPGMPKLFIASEKARITFLSIMESYLCEGYDVESWVAFETAIADERY